MSNVAIHKKDNMDKQEPDIFRAAKNGDLQELQDALDAGQTLQDRKTSQAFMTPVHIAAWCGKEDFVAKACDIDPVPANMLDGYGCFPFDYAFQRGDEKALDVLSSSMPSQNQPFPDADFNF